MKIFRKIKLYVQESYTELIQKVSWPSWSDLQGSAIIVMVAAVILSLVILLMDISFKNFIQVVYNLFS